MKEADVTAVVEVAEKLPAEARQIRKKTAKKSAGQMVYEAIMAEKRAEEKPKAKTTAEMAATKKPPI